MNQSDELRAFKAIHEAQELWEEHGCWERWWCGKCGALYEWNPEMSAPEIEIPTNSKYNFCIPKGLVGAKAG